MSQRPNGTGSRQLLGILESLLTQPQEPLREEVESAHGSATHAIRSVNERLAEVHQLIAAGRRAEGIEMAEGPPHVLDEIALLDSPLIRDWEHWSGQFGLPRFAPLRTDLASMLSGAYTAENQLEHLLRRHRLLSIGRANLKQRIGVLSQLAAADPGNPSWNEALKEYQELRMEQLASRAKKAMAIQDLRCLEQILGELRQTRWLIPIPSAPFKAIARDVKSIKSREFTCEAIALAEHIQDAFAAGEKERLKPLIARWREINSFLDTQDLAEVLPSIQSVMDWFDSGELQRQTLEQQNRALQRAGSVSSTASSEELRSVIDTVAATGAAVPNELRQAYSEKVNKEKRAKRRKASFIAGGIAAALLAATTVAAIAYRGYQREAALVQMVEAVDQSLRRDEIETVQRLLDSAPVDDTRFDEFRSALEQKKLAENRRADEFRDSAAELRQLIDTAMEMDEFDSIEFRLEELTDQAIQTDELATSRNLQELSQTKRAERKNEFVSATHSLIQKMKQGLKSLVPDRQARGKLTTWNQQIQQRRTNRWIRQDTPLLIKLDSASNAVADQRDRIRRMADSEQSIAKITASVGDWDIWESLGEQADQSEGVVRNKLSAIANCVREERSLWEGIEQWNAMGTKWKLDQLLTATPGQAVDVVADVAAIERSNLNDLPPARDLIVASKIAAPAAAKSKRNLALIRDHLKSPKMTELYCVEVLLSDSAPARWYYFRSLEEISVVGDEVKISHWTDLDLSQTDLATVPLVSIRMPDNFPAQHESYVPGGAESKKLIAPHAPICSNLFKRLARLESSPQRWDQAFVATYREIVDAEGLDPIVQAFLANSLLEIGSKGSWTIASAYQDHIELFQTANLRIDVNWIDPADEAAILARRQATEVLEKLKSIQAVNPAPRLEQLTGSLVLNTTYRPVGWLDQFEGRWIVRGKSLPETGSLFVRYQDSGVNRTRQIGTLSGGDAALSSDSAPDLRVGRPVWVASVEAGAETFDKRRLSSNATEPFADPSQEDR